MVAPSSRHAATSPRHGHTGTEPGSRTGTLVGCRSRASVPGLSAGRMSSDMATSPGAGARGGAAGWEGCTAPPSPVPHAQGHIMGHPSLPRSLQVKYTSYLIKASFVVTAEKGIFRSLFQDKRNHASKIFTEFLYSQKMPVRGMQQSLFDIFRLLPLCRQYFTAALVSVPSCQRAENHDSGFLACSSTWSQPGLQSACSSG